MLANFKLVKLNSSARGRPIIKTMAREVLIMVRLTSLLSRDANREPRNFRNRLDKKESASRRIKTARTNKAAAPIPMRSLE